MRQGEASALSFINEVPKLGLVAGLNGEAKRHLQLANLWQPVQVVAQATAAGGGFDAAARAQGCSALGCRGGKGSAQPVCAAAQVKGSRLRNATHFRVSAAEATYYVCVPSCEPLFNTLNSCYRLVD